MRRGRVGGTTAAGRALQYTTGAALGKIGSDAIQFVAGGGGPTEDEVRLAQALAQLQGNN